jgi:cell division protein ZapB
MVSDYRISPGPGGVDRQSGAQYSVLMTNDKNPQSITEQELRKLEQRLEALVTTIQRLKDENRSLRNQQESLVTERAGLIEKNELARSRVEAMINRLKAMEQGV